MLPEYPAITKCISCNTIFWLNGSKSIGSYHPFGIKEICDTWKAATPARFLTPYEYDAAYEADRNAPEQELLFLFKRIWWGFNDRGRKGGGLFNSNEDEKLWDRNMLRLLYLLHDEDASHRILKAELFRNHGDFDLSLEILSGIRDPAVERHKEVCERACHSKNRLVLPLPKVPFPGLI